MQVIPIEQGIPFQEVTVRIEDKDYILTFGWNFRRSVWSLTVSDIDRVDIYAISSLTLDSFSGILAVHNPDMPQGSFSIIDTSFSKTEASLDSLGTTHQLLYLTSAELDAMLQ